LSAKLILHPHEGTYNQTILLPDNVVLYWTDKKNRINDALYDITNSAMETSTLIQDKEYGENTYYSISILGFVATELANEQFTDHALMVLLPSSTLTTSFQQLILDDQTQGNHSMELELHYLTY